MAGKKDTRGVKSGIKTLRLILHHRELCQSRENMALSIQPCMVISPLQVVLMNTCHDKRIN